ncbi:MAG TPA: hypothetical protein VGR53_03425 [Nitrososphaerales archaeon]|nr:hypothetical protein [Nitrososphaerales archaeon]
MADRLVPALLDIGTTIEKYRNEPPNSNAFDFFLSDSLGKIQAVGEAKASTKSIGLNLYQLSKYLKYQNRTLISSYIEIGESLGFFTILPLGRAKFVGTTGSFHFWSRLALGKFGDFAREIRAVTKRLKEDELGEFLWELRNTFEIAEVLEKDPLAKRRYQVLTEICAGINIKKSEAREIRAEIIGEPKRRLDELRHHLELMQEMTKFPSDSLEGFDVRQEGQRLILDWKESGSEESQAKG